MRRALFLLALLLALGAGAYRLLRPAPPVRAAVTLAEALAGDTTGYARARHVRPFRFPGDHGPHPDFKTEWWYVTGNVATAEGRRFGYELTFFRIALAPPGSDRPLASAWATRQVYMAHLAVTDVAGERFYPYERLARGAAGLAGAGPGGVWLEDWSLSALPGTPNAFRLRARAGAVALDLDLRPRKPVVLQGDRGLDRKGAAPGNASYYYSLTRLDTRGTLAVDGRSHPVTGLSWLDREWSTSALDGNQVGWDWFALHLDDGRDLMYYQLRERSGRAGPFSHGVLVEGNGAARPLPAVDLGVEAHWESPRGGRYPARWRLRVPGERLDLTLVPLLADQELPGIVRYWEGAVRVTGTADGRPAGGYGYVELTGYGDTPPLSP